MSALRRAHPELPLTITTFTPTGAARARRCSATLRGCVATPLRSAGGGKPLLPALQPRLAVISRPSCGRTCIAPATGAYRWCWRARASPALGRPLPAARTAVQRYARPGRRGGRGQGSADAERFRSLGAEAGTHVTGNPTRLRDCRRISPRAARHCAASSPRSGRCGWPAVRTGWRGTGAHRHGAAAARATAAGVAGDGAPVIRSVSRKPPRRSRNRGCGSSAARWRIRMRTARCCCSIRSVSCWISCGGGRGLRRRQPRAGGWP